MKTENRNKEKEWIKEDKEIKNNEMEEGQDKT